MTGDRLKFVFNARTQSLSKMPLGSVAFQALKKPAIATLRSGIPYDVTYQGDLANTGNTFVRANLVGNPRLANPTPAAWIDTSALAVPAPYTFGNLGRNSLRSDWSRNLDWSLFRRFLLSDRIALEYRAEAFNTTNTAVFAVPGNVINGPNLGRLGRRETQVYGSTTHDDLVAMIEREATELDLKVVVRQSDSEAELLGWIHRAADAGEPVILNAGALTHTSIALRDACAELRAPLIEVHISNVHAREEFRHHSYLSAIATGVIVGLGVQGYLLALRYLATLD
jgi:3-dehydroquinate dehydratase-2